MKHKRFAAGLAGAFGLISLLLATALGSAQGPSRQPVYWVENKGQFDERVLYRSEGSRDIIWLLEDEIWLTVAESGQGGPAVSGPGGSEDRSPARIQNIRISFPGSGSQTVIDRGEPVDFIRNYFAAGGLFERVPLWGEVRYASISQGIDLMLVANGGGIDFELQAQGARTRLELLVEGADELRIVNSQIVVRTAFGERALPFRTGSGSLELVVSTPAGSAVSFSPGSVTEEPASPPQAPASGEIVYGTYHGVAGLLEFGAEIVVDPDGNAYTAGSSEMPVAFSAQPGLQTPMHLVSVFVLKLNADGTAAEYLTTIAGMKLGDEDFAHDIELDSQQNVYVTGMTSSSDFPTTPGAFDVTQNGGNDAWVAKLNPAGGVIFSTVVGSLGNDWANGVALGLFGEVYITGFTNGPGFPKTTGSFDPSHNGGFDAFVAKLSNDGATLIAGTFIGGSGNEGGDFNFDRSDIHIDSVGSAVITGPTQSANYPITGPVIGPGGCKDVFVSKFSPTLSALYYSARIGGSGASCGFNGDDNPERLDVDLAGRVYITGYTTSSQAEGFPVTAGAYDTTYGGNFDAFVLVFEPSSFDLIYGTYLGGGSVDAAKDLQVDGEGRILITGYTFSTNYPTTGNAFDLTLSGGLDAFITQLDPNGSGAADLIYSSFLGGGNADQGVGLFLFGQDILFLTGLAETGFPVTPGSYQDTNSGDRDAYVVRFHLLDPQPPPAPQPTWTPAAFDLQLPAVFDDFR